MENKFKEIFEKELAKHNLNWCKGCDASLGHKRGFVLNNDKATIHLDRAIATRATLHRALHEVGHCVNDEKGQLRWQQESGAEEFANKTMKEYGISVPRKTKARGVSYVKRKKRHGDNIRRGRK